MEIKKLYHLTLLVEDLPQAEAFYAQVFSPLCFMRGYAPFPLHRDAALLAIADTVIEPMQPLPPRPIRGRRRSIASSSGSALASTRWRCSYPAPKS